MEIATGFSVIALILSGLSALYARDAVIAKKKEIKILLYDKRIVLLDKFNEMNSYSFSEEIGENERRTKEFVRILDDTKFLISQETYKMLHECVISMWELIKKKKYNSKLADSYEELSTKETNKLYDKQNNYNSLSASVKIALENEIKLY